MKVKQFLADIRLKSREDLLDVLSMLRLERYQLFSTRSSNKYSENASLFKQNKKKIARVLTVLKETECV